MSKGFTKYPLADRVLEALAKLGWKRPTAVQEEVIPMILNRRNVVVEAATGTGKTAAYGLPLLSRIDYTKRSTQVLVLVPSRELAQQVEAALKTFSTHEKLRVASVYGGMSLAESEKKIKSSPHVLVAVPGRLKDSLVGGRLDHFWRDIKYLVIDEADKLLEAGFQDMLDNLVSHLRNMVQVALFSATISQDVEAMIKERFHPLQVVRLSPKEALRNITFHYIVVDQGQKQRYLGAILRNQKVRQALVFTPNREEVYALANFLRSMGLKAEAYHGLLDQVARTAVMKRFKNKQVDFLVATDLAARGLDVQDLPCVVNYAFPDELEIYLHRCGRTGRAGQRGAVYNLVASKMEEVLVGSFHTELQIGLHGFQVEPLSKEAVRDVEEKLVKVHLSRGKRDKVSSGDVVGFLVNNTGVEADKIGTIAVYDAYTLVDLPEWALDVLALQDDHKLKGKGVKLGKFSLDDQKRRAEALKKSRLGVRDKEKALEQVERKAAKKTARKQEQGAAPASRGASKPERGPDSRPERKSRADAAKPAKSAGAPQKKSKDAPAKAGKPLKKAKDAPAKAGKPTGKSKPSAPARGRGAAPEKGRGPGRKQR